MLLWGMERGILEKKKVVLMERRMVMGWRRMVRVSFAEMCCCLG